MQLTRAKSREEKISGRETQELIFAAARLKFFGRVPGEIEQMFEGTFFKTKNFLTHFFSFNYF